MLRVPTLSLALMWGLTACVGEIGDGPAEWVTPDDPFIVDPPTNPLPEPPVLPLRRLTNVEYAATIDAAFRHEDDDTLPSRWFALPALEAADVFTNDIGGLTVGTGTFAEYVASAEALADNMALRPTFQQRAYVECDDWSDDASKERCTELFVQDVGPRLWRRPLTEDDHAGLMNVYRANADCTGAGEECLELSENDRYKTLLMAMVLSPQTLYLLEPEGEGYPAWDESYPWYVASRLSFLLWGAPPDQELYDAAAAGTLIEAESLRGHAERMMDDPQFTQNIGRFVFETLRLGRWEGFYKAESLDFRCMETDNGCTPAKEIIRANFDENVRRHFEGDGDLRSFFVEPNTFGPEMQAYYGEGSYPGVLGHPVFNWVHSNYSSTSPIGRGVTVRERLLLCGHLPAPPMNIPAVQRTEGLSVRERFAEHSANSACRGCHELIDPLGFVFEAYDWTGRYREEETAIGGDIVPIDTSGALDGEPVNNPAELFAAISESTDARECYVEQLLRFSILRPADARDDERRAALMAEFESAEWSLRSLLLEIATSDIVLFARENDR